MSSQLHPCSALSAFKCAVFILSTLPKLLKIIYKLTLLLRHGMGEKVLPRGGRYLHTSHIRLLGFKSWLRAWPQPLLMQSSEGSKWQLECWHPCRPCARPGWCPWFFGEWISRWKLSTDISLSYFFFTILSMYMSRMTMDINLGWQ